MLYLLAILLAIVQAGTVRVCKCEDGVETAMNIPDEFLTVFMEQYPDSCEGSCNSCDCAPASGGRVVRRTFEIRPSGAGYSVPMDKETVYGCVLFDASKFTEDQWITHIDIDVNMSVMHHGVVYEIPEGTTFDTAPYTGCQPYGPEYGPLAGKINYASCVDGAGSVYGHGDVVPDCFELRGVFPKPPIKFAFQRGNPDFTAPAGTGILVGPSTGAKWYLIQAHYHNMMHGGGHGGMAMKNAEMMEPIIDKSGLIIETTNKNPGKNLGILLMGNLPHESIYAPPHQEEFTVLNDVAASGCGYPTQNEFYFGASGPIAGGANLSYPCVPGAGPIGLFGHMVSKSNYQSEILPNGGIDLHLSGLHWHLKGSAAAYVLRANAGGRPTLEEYDHHSQDDSSTGSGEHDHTTDHGQTTNNGGGASFGKCSPKPADQNGDPSISNLHCYRQPVHVGLGDGLRSVFKYNTTMAHMTITGGYATTQEMALQFVAYTPAPATDSTIYAINSCRTCLGALSQPLATGLFVPPFDGVNCADAYSCAGQPFTLEDPVTGAQQFCYPNVFQSVIQQSGACATQCTGAFCQSA